MDNILPPDRLAQIQARADIATPGPWVWHGNLTGKGLELKSLAPMHPIVMIFRRWGMQSAMPWFRNRLWDLMDKPRLIPSAPHNPWDIVAIDHPDAVFIAAARSDVDALLVHVRAMDALLTELEMEAAHDY